MPALKSRNVGLAFDMHGCPNRCRHCYISPVPNKQLSEQDVRWATKLFRSFRRKSEEHPFIEKLRISTWVREPDFSDDYRELHELEAELSDGDPPRYELLSTWRLARDKSYAEWAKQVGPDTSQITFFGMEKTTDWFHRRKGAFRDNVAATQRLLEVGMKPRWQLFLTKKIIPELDDLLALVKQLELRERVEALGGEFVLFMHTPGPDGEARQIEHLRPTEKDVQDIPQEILKSSRKHYKSETLWETEARLYSQILSGEDRRPPLWSTPDGFWFFVAGNFDVFTNLAAPEPWWKLGNLKMDSIETMLDRFENNEILGFKTICTVSAKELTREFGNPRGKRIYTDQDDLLGLYLARHCEQRFAGH